MTSKRHGCKKVPTMYTYICYINIVGTFEKLGRRLELMILREKKECTLWGPDFCPHNYDSPQSAGV